MAESIQAVLDGQVLPTVLGSDPFDLAAIHAEMPFLPDNHGAKCCVDVALHDLLGRAVGRPVYDLLGVRVATPCRRLQPPASFPCKRQCG